ncbi:zinc finger protein 836-like [Macrobrachium nipponense]|uniref:zinc finger protein 836-like n=1 Tax=Macrobrachium nipponense TaxID=159736 RepID=UPI0030C824B8
MGHYVCSWCNIAFGELSILHLHMGVHIELVGPKGSSSVEIPGGHMVSEVKESSDEQGEYYCKVCQKYFNNLGIFTFHMRAHCEGKSFQCTICGVVFSTKSAVYNHVCSHVNEKLCKCTRGHLALQGKDDQPKIFESANDLHKCGVCDGGYSTKKRLDRHTLKHMGHFSCSICKRSYQGQVEYDKHMVYHAYVMFFRCEVCFETFDDRIKRDDHMKVHSSSYCGEMVLTDQSGVPKPSALKDGEVWNDCKDISEEKGSKKLKSGCLQGSDTDFVPFSTTTTVPQTVRSPVSQDLFRGKKRSDLRSILKDIGVSRGTVLKRSEKAKSDLVSENSNDIEVVSKESPKEYQATVVNGCNIFERKSSQRKESGKYKCKLCFSVWKEKHAFWQHLHEHSDDVPYTCKICVEVFDDVESWKVHKEQKCTCALCGKLMQRIDYAVHNKACPVNNPFKCLVCFKRFLTSDLFREHMKSHSREQACRCKVCGEVLLLKYEAERHNKMHKKESIDLVSMPLLSEDELLTVTLGAQNPLCKVKSEHSLQTSDVSDKERDVKVPLSSIKTENYIESGSVNTLSAIIVKEEPFFEDKNVFNDAVLTTDVEQRYVVMVTDEANDFNQDENIVDPLA